MNNIKLLFKQEFNIDGQVFVGKVEKDMEDIYISIYHNNEKIKTKLYTGTNDEISWLSEIESLIEDD